MSTLTLTLSGSNGSPQNWSDVSVPLEEIRTWANTTKLSYVNVQENGLRPSNIRTLAEVDAVRIRVRNVTGSTIAANQLVYFTGTYSDGTNNYPTISKAISTASAGTNFFARAVSVESIANNTDGTVAVFYEVTGANTGSATVGDPVYLSTTAGEWTLTRPTGGQFVQVVGNVSVVNASSGRIILSLGAVPEFLKGGSSGLDATFNSVTATTATISGGTITGITDLAVADGGTGASTASAARTSLGLGSIATQASNSVSITGGSVTGITDVTVADGGTGASDAAGARTNLGLVIGTNVQAYDAGLADIAGLATSDGNVIVGSGSNWVAESGATARTSLGLGSIATQASDSVSITGGSVTGITDITVADGGTGASNASGARTNLGIAIGSDVQAYDAGLADIAALATTDGNIIVGSGSNWVAESGATARTSLGLGSIATQAADNVSISGGSFTGMTSYSGGSFSGTTGTFSGDVAVDTDTLFVDVSEDKVGVNVNNPVSALHVNAEATFGPDTNNRGIVNYGSNVLALSTVQGGTTYYDTVKISNGDVGIGSSPSSVWGNVFRVLQIGPQASINVVSSASETNHMSFTQNAQYDDETDNRWEYITTNGYAANYYMYAGSHNWRVNNVAGTAGNEVTWNSAMTLTNAGRLGIATSSPQALLHTSAGGSNITSPTGNTQAIFANTAAADSVSRVCILAGTGSGYSVLDFADTSRGSATDNGNITYNHAAERMTFATDVGTTRIAVDSDGLKFGSDTAAANALDDYEEGTHVVTIGTGTSGSLGLNPGRNTIQYTKVGDLVLIQGFLEVNSATAGVGYVTLSMPFVNSNQTQYSGITVGKVILNMSGGPLHCDQYVLYMTNGASELRIYATDSGLLQADAAEHITTNGGADIFINFSYRTT